MNNELSFSQLNNEALSSLIYLAQKEMEKREVETLATELPDQITDLRIPPYILITFTEHLYACFLEELFNNYDPEGDYSTDDPTELNNTNSIKITNSFNRLDYKDGQYPKIIVQALGSDPNKQFIGNDSPYKSNTSGFIGNKNSEKSAYFQVPVQISVLTQNYNEANILGNLVQMSLLENFDVLQRIFGFNYVSEPRMSAARKIKEVDDVFASTISFVNGKYVQWSGMIASRNYRAIIYRLVAKTSKEDDDSISHFISLLQGMPLDPELKNYIQLKYGMDGI